MAETAYQQQSAYQADFERFVSAREEPQFIARLRQAGWRRYVDAGFPTTRREQWRFTDLRALAALDLGRPDETPIDAGRLPTQLSADSIRLVFVNSRYAPGLSRIEDRLPDGAVIGSLAQALQTQPGLIEAHLDQTREPTDHPFSALNSAFMEDGAVVYLPAGAILEAPLELVFYSNSGRHHGRNLIVLERGAQASIVEQHCGDGVYLSAPVSELIMGDGAICHYHKLQHEAAQAYHLGAVRSKQARDSQLSMHLLTSAGLLNRSDVMALLDGEGAYCALHGLTLVEDGQLGDYHVHVEHAKPHGSSEQLFKNVLNGRSRSVFDGLIEVAKDAQKTDARQSSRNLLLSKRAQAQSNPRLEILADDVKCAHGSTTGFLDQNALFYLRSRGLPEAEARALLVYAFVNEQLEAITLAALRERLQNLIVGRFGPTATT